MKVENQIRNSDIRVRLAIHVIQQLFHLRVGLAVLLKLFEK